MPSSSDIWWGLDLITEMTAHNVNCLLSPWSSFLLLGLYQNTPQPNTQQNQMQDNDDEQQNSPRQDYNNY